MFGRSVSWNCPHGPPFRPSGEERRPFAEARKNSKQRYLLLIDEINRADLGRVLGEAIYLFEPREIKQGEARVVKLPYGVDGQHALSIPSGLYVLGTMNSADRSIAILDLAVRRRFAFVDVWPDLDIVKQQGYALATQAFAQLQDIFAQYAPYTLKDANWDSIKDVFADRCIGALFSPYRSGS